MVLCGQVRKAGILGSIMLLAACAHSRPPLASPLAIPASRLSSFDSNDPQPTSTFARSMAGAVSLRKGSDDPVCALPRFAGVAPRKGGAPQYVVLSGGSLHGAFGAGFFLGLQDHGALPPEPDVVTGVSTGSLQSTFLFLARQPAPADRKYGWIGGLATKTLPGADNSAPLKGGRSNIEDLALAYSISKEGDILSIVPFGGIGMLIEGSKGNLAPLRKRLLELITPGTIDEIAGEACRGRKLFVGVTDVDDGHGYALDLTALALKAYVGEKPDQRMTEVRRAYVEALLASSSVPVGAKPVSLRTREFDPAPAEVSTIHLYIDGGARFGVFLDQIRASESMARVGGAPGGEGAVTLVVNTSLAMPPWQESDAAGHAPRAPKDKWSLVSLALRGIDVMENQVYQASVASVMHDAGHLDYATLSNAGIVENGKPAETPNEHVYDGKTCKEWHDADTADMHPVQFYPRYMACLLDYGRRRGQLSEWNR